MLSLSTLAEFLSILRTAEQHEAEVVAVEQALERAWSATTWVDREAALHDAGKVLAPLADQYLPKATLAVAATATTTTTVAAGQPIPQAVAGTGAESPAAK